MLVGFWHCDQTRTDVIWPSAIVIWPMTIGHRYGRWSLCFIKPTWSILREFFCETHALSRVSWSHLIFREAQKKKAWLGAYNIVPVPILRVAESLICVKTRFFSLFVLYAKVVTFVGFADKFLGLAKCGEQDLSRNFSWKKQGLFTICLFVCCRVRLNPVFIT